MILIISSLIISITIDTTEKPVINSITPQIGVPGDIMIITGSGFGDVRDTSQVEIGGSALISSLYLSWSDSQIKILIPADVQDGLVYVITKGGKSEPMIFANRENVPVAVTQERRAALPVIFSTTPQTLSVGQILTITGENFGTVRNESAVYFTPVWMEGKNSIYEIDNIEQNYITAFDNDFDYEFWSDTEIRVRIPDSAVSGYIFVLTEKGSSNRTRISITSPVGTKKLSSKLTYLIELSTDISDIKGDENSFITLRIPRPQPSASQPYIEMTECIPEPIFDNYGKTIIHHIQTSDYNNTSEKLYFKHNFVIPVYSVT
ncbi:MAG: IPT/TIG domain-containing protein, partial [Spirochaetaceae bacterium]|nr:IPT/TIG domain-containing protein [Spirochaetaceae bacterium]